MTITTSRAERASRGPASEGAPGTGVLVLRRTLAAPPDRVFAAWTRPELIRRWFGPGPMGVEEAELDVRVGGSYRIVMREPADAGGAGEPHTPHGVYEEIVPDRKLVFSWQWEGTELVTRVTVELRQLGDDRTELTLTHEGFPEAAMRDEHERGWSGSLDKLPGLLAGAATKADGEGP